MGMRRREEEGKGVQQGTDAEGEERTSPRRSRANVRGRDGEGNEQLQRVAGVCGLAEFCAFCVCIVCVLRAGCVCLDLPPNSLFCLSMVLCVSLSLFLQSLVRRSALSVHASHSENIFS